MHRNKMGIEVRPGIDKNHIEFELEFGRTECWSMLISSLKGLFVGNMYLSFQHGGMVVDKEKSRKALNMIGR